MSTYLARESVAVRRARVVVMSERLPCSVIGMSGRAIADAGGKITDRFGDNKWRHRCHTMTPNVLARPVIPLCARTP